MLAQELRKLNEKLLQVLMIASLSMDAIKKEKNITSVIFHITLQVHKLLFAFFIFLFSFIKFVEYIKHPIVIFTMDEKYFDMFLLNASKSRLR